MLGGTQWGDAELRPLDAYIQDGGKVLFAVKGLHVQTVGTFTAEPVGNSALLDMLESYGVRVGREMVLDTSSRDYRLPQQRPNGQIGWETIGKYPPWVSVQGPNVSSTHPVTARFIGLDLLWPVALTAAPREGVRIEPLVKSTTLGVGAESAVHHRSLQGGPAGSEDGAARTRLCPLPGHSRPVIRPPATRSREHPRAWSSSVMTISSPT